MCKYWEVGGCASPAVEGHSRPLVGPDCDDDSIFCPFRDKKEATSAEKTMAALIGRDNIQLFLFTSPAQWDALILIAPENMKELLSYWRQMLIRAWEVTDDIDG